MNAGSEGKGRDGRHEHIIARYLKAVDDKREVVCDPDARYFGGPVDDRSLVPLGDARLGRVALDEWVSRLS